MYEFILGFMVIKQTLARKSLFLFSFFFFLYQMINIIIKKHKNSKITKSIMAAQLCRLMQQLMAMPVE